MFQSIYESPWHHPALFWAAGVLFLAFWARKKPFLTAFIALFVVEILADALFTSVWAPGGFRSSRWATPVAIAFVIAGDFRYFLLVERFVRRPETMGGPPGQAGLPPQTPRAKPADVTTLSAWATAIALAFLVPVASTIVTRFYPAHLAGTRWTFLTYESMFLALALTLRLAVLPRRLGAAPARMRAWLLRVTTFEIVQYGLWVLADIIILSGADVGFALRLVPNTMYYALFLPFVALTAPAEVDA